MGVFSATLNESKAIFINNLWTYRKIDCKVSFETVRVPPKVEKLCTLSDKERAKSMFLKP